MSRPEALLWDGNGDNGNIGSYYFYESSRRNVAILLVFWTAYIAAYLLLARLVRFPLFSGGVGQKRRSNLSRLMLLERHSDRRTRSLTRALSAGVADLSKASGDILSSMTAAAETSDSDRAPSLSLSPFSSYNLSDMEGGGSWGGSAMVLSGQSFSRKSTVLASFVPEFTIAAVALAVLLQSILLIPMTIFLTTVLQDARARLSWHWQWLTHELLEQWWRWLWNSALLLLYLLIPLGLLLYEGKEYRNAPLLRRIAILRAKFFSFGYTLPSWRPLLSILLPLYLILAWLGYASIVDAHQWLLYLNAFTIGGCALLSVACVSIGILAEVRWIVNRTIRPGLRSELALQLSTLERQISVLEDGGGEREQGNEQGRGSASSIIASQSLSQSESCAIPPASPSLRRLALSFDDLRQKSVPTSPGTDYPLGATQSTPISSKSVRSRLIELRARTEALRQMLRRTWYPVWHNFLVVLMLIVALAALLLFFHSLLMAFFNFLAKHLLWHLPGIQSLHHFLSTLSKMLGLYTMTPLRDEERIPIGMAWKGGLLRCSFLTLYFLGHLTFGMVIIFCRRVHLSDRREHHPSHRQQQSSLSFTIRRLALDRLLFILLICMLSMVVGSVLAIAAGNVDDCQVLFSQGRRAAMEPKSYLNNSQHDELEDSLSPSSALYMSALFSFFPDPIRRLLDMAYLAIVLRFPLLLWIILFYRFVLLLTLILAVFRAITALLYALSFDLNGRVPLQGEHIHRIRPSVHP